MLNKFLNKVESIYEEYYEKDDIKQTFFDALEMGADENEKAKIFRKLQDICQDRNLELDVEEGLKDPLTNTILVDKDNDDPIKALLKYLDIESLARIPIRSLDVEDVVDAVKHKDSAIQAPGQTKDYEIIVTVDPSHPDIDNKSVLQAMNNMFTSMKTTVSNAGVKKGDTMYTMKYKAFSPKDITRDDLTAEIGKNKGMFQDMGVKTVDIVED